MMYQRNKADQTDQDQQDALNDTQWARFQSDDMFKVKGSTHQCYADEQGE
ncbi:MAG: hypothetical protein ACJAXR_002152 [Halopseudomonas sp.]|jgi:hypothetical protein